MFKSIQYEILNESLKTTLNFFTMILHLLLIKELNLILTIKQMINKRIWRWDNAL